MSASFAKFIAIFSFSFFLMVSNSHGSSQADKLRELLNNPNFPEDQKVKIREGLKKLEAAEKEMASKTTFKNSKEWYGHFKFMWKQTRSKMDSIRKEEKKNYRKAYEINYEAYEKSRLAINKKFKTNLIVSKRFPESIKELNNFNNDANPYYSSIEKIFIKHIHSKMVEASRKFAKTEEEKIRAQAMEKVSRNLSKLITLKPDDINFIVKDMIAYFKENQKIYIQNLNNNRKAKKLAISTTTKKFKGLFRPSAPKNDSRYYPNQHRDYLIAVGQLDSVYYSEPLIYKYFKVLDQAALKKFKLETNTKIKEFNKLLKIVKSSMDLEYLHKNKAEVRKSIQSYQTNGLSRRMREAFRKVKIDDNSPDLERKASKEKIKKWTVDFLAKHKPKKLKLNIMNSKTQYWFGNLISL